MRVIECDANSDALVSDVDVVVAAFMRELEPQPPPFLCDFNIGTLQVAREPSDPQASSALWRTVELSVPIG